MMTKNDGIDDDNNDIQSSDSENSFINAASNVCDT